MSLSNNDIEILAQELVSVSLNGDSGTRVLVGNLVNFLAKKGVIDRNEYLDYVKETSELLSEDSDSENEARNNMIKSVFDLHINDFQ